MIRFLLLTLTVSLLFFTGCQQETEQDPPLNQQETNNPMMQVKQPQTKDQPDLSNEQIATHLANIASSVPQVNNATAIVAGPYAVVGINVDGELDRSKVATIKYSVSEALKDDPYGKTAVVVADADLTARIEAMNEKIQQGHPIQGIVEELSAIVGRFMPEFPVPEDIPQEQDQKENILDENEEQQLDEIEREQSGEQQN